ncbi:MAG: hypothetical protein JNK72_13375 [Myxococcales bacterium]|nr:hypothetical protein [Myxococcales bacterium]
MSAANERALAVFEAFLRFSREAAAPAPPSQAPSVSDTEEGPTDVKINAPRSAVPPTIAPLGGGSSVALPLVNIQGAATPVFVRLPSAAPQAVEPEAPRDDEKTRITVLPEAFREPASPSSEHPVIDEDNWDGPTQDRREGAPSVDTDVSLTLPDTPARPLQQVEERSIIVDDDTLTDPEFGPEAMQNVAKMVRTAPITLITVDAMYGEMCVLVKYGHAEQAVGEIERWITMNPDEQRAHQDLVGRIRDKFPRDHRVASLARKYGV